MPIAAKLSKQFYEKLGEQVVGEMIDLFNQVDATYRSDLREFNEMNFARFDAKLEQRLTEQRAELELKIERFGTQLDAKIDRVAGELNAKIDGVAIHLDARVDRLGADLRTEMALMRSDLIKWSFLFWIGTVLTIVASMKFLR